MKTCEFFINPHSFLIINVFQRIIVEKIKTHFVTKKSFFRKS
jgi:hypothetical protein